MTIRKTSEQFINEAKVIHDGIYDYSLVDYKNNSTKILIICETHGQFSQTPSSHTVNKSGCPMCRTTKIAQTNLRKYGTKSPIQNLEIKEKIKQTNLEKYGAENAFQNVELQNKQKQTMMERYGVEYSSQIPESVAMKKETYIKNYGVDHPFKSKEIKERIKQTNLEKYGVDYPHQQHMIDILPLITDYNWLFDQYINLGKTATQIANELGSYQETICHYLKIHEINIRNSVQYSYACICWLEYIMECDDVLIQHAHNGGEYKIPGTNYKADGYCQETNTIYEFHGDYWHGNPEIYPPTFSNVIVGKTMGELYNKTINRENKIKSLNYNLVVMWENQWNIQQKELNK